MIPGDLLSAFPHRQFHTLPGLLDSWAALPNSYPNAYMPMQGGSLYHFYDGLWYDPAERRTHDLPCKRRTRYRLSQPDTVPLERTMVNGKALIFTLDDRPFHLKGHIFGSKGVGLRHTVQTASLFGSAARLSKRLGSVGNCLWRHAL